MEDAGQYRIKCVNRVGATNKDSKFTDVYCLGLKKSTIDTF